MKILYLDQPILRSDYIYICTEFVNFIISQAFESLPEIVPNLDKLLSSYINRRFGKNWRDVVKKYNAQNLLETVYVSPPSTLNLRRSRLTRNLYFGYVSSERYPSFDLPNELRFKLESEWVRVLEERERVYLNYEREGLCSLILNAETTPITYSDIKRNSPDFYSWLIQFYLKFNDRVLEITQEDDLKLLVQCLPDTTSIFQEHQEEGQVKE